MAKISASSLKKTSITNPGSGRSFEIDTVIYDPFKKAILASLRNSKGKPFTDLADDVVKTINRKMPEFKRSIPWYTISVLRDLETRGIVETFTQKGKKLNRLSR